MRHLFLFVCFVFFSFSFSACGPEPSCLKDEDCETSFYCDSSLCKSDCSSNDDCQKGFLCSSNGRCLKSEGIEKVGEVKEEQNQGLCQDGQEQSCFPGKKEQQGIGRCRVGKQFCKQGVWSTCIGFGTPKKEECNGVDDDCDGQADEELSKVCGVDIGICKKGKQICRSGVWGSCVGEVKALKETCDGILDEDCDGVVDNGCGCLHGKVRSCGIVGVGVCKQGKETCVNGRWETCLGEVKPQKEECNGLDDDCDGNVDEELFGKACGSDVGVCKKGTQVCQNGRWKSCVGEVKASKEVCNGKDDDCDGNIDENLPDCSGLRTISLSQTIDVPNTHLHSQEVYSVTFSPDGKIIASGAGYYPPTVKLWEAKTGKLLRTFHLPKVKPTLYNLSLSFSPDSKTLVVAPNTGSILLYDVSTGKQVKYLLGHSESVHSVEWSPDGKSIVAATGHGIKGKGSIHLWDVATAKIRYSIFLKTTFLFSARFSPDGKTLAAGIGNKTIKFWDAASGKLLKTVVGKQDPFPTGWLEWSPDGTTLALMGLDKTIGLFDIRSATFSRILIGHKHRLSSIAWSPDSKTLVSTASDGWTWQGTIKLWDSNTGKEKASFSGRTDIINSIAWSPDGKTLVSGDRKAGVKLWDAKTVTVSKVVSGFYGLVKTANIEKTGTFLAMAGLDRRVQLWNLKTKQWLQTSPETKDEIEQIVWGPSGKLVAFSDRSGGLKLWDTQKNKILINFVTGQKDIDSLAMSPDGKVIASAWFDIKLWDSKSGKLLKTLPGHSGDSSDAMVFSPDGKILASGGDRGDGTTKLWELSSGNLLKTFSGTSKWGVTAIAFSSDGKLVASANSGDSIQVWDVKSGKLLHNLGDSTGHVNSLSFGDHGNILVSGYFDGSVRLWDLQNGSLIKEFQHHGKSVSFVRFLDKPRSFVSIGSDLKIRYWD